MFSEARAIPGFDGYFVTSHGEVWSTRKSRAGEAKVMRPGENRDGYPQVCLTQDGRKLTRGLHVLVARTWIGPAPDGQVVRHKDGDKDRPHVDNLEYGTPQQNAADTVRQGAHHLASRQVCVNGHEFTPENTYVRPSPPGTVWRACRRCKADRMKPHRIPVLIPDPNPEF